MGRRLLSVDPPALQLTTSHHPMLLLRRPDLRMFFIQYIFDNFISLKMTNNNPRAVLCRNGSLGRSLHPGWYQAPRLCKDFPSNQPWSQAEPGTQAHRLCKDLQHSGFPFKYPPGPGISSICFHNQGQKRQTRLYKTELPTSVHLHRDCVHARTQGSRWTS